MNHAFNVSVAVKYGVHSAILLENIAYWCKKNEANEVQYHDGLYWTYNSKKAFSELFPYMTARQIDYALKRLIDDGIIVTGNFNTVAYDRTLWYAVTKKGYSILQNCEMVEQNCEMDERNLYNGTNKIVEPIPYINTDINKNINKNINYEQIKDLYNETCVSLPRLTVLSDKRKQAIRARFNTYTIDQFKELFAKAQESSFLKGGNDRNWSANFDWLMKDANFAKVLDGNYDNRVKAATTKNNMEETYGERRKKAEESAINEWGNIGTYI